MLLFLHVCVAVWMQQTVNVISFIQKQKANMFADVRSGFTAAVSLGSLTAVSYRGNTVQSLQRFTDWTWCYCAGCLYLQTRTCQQKETQHVSCVCQCFICDFWLKTAHYDLNFRKHDYLSLVISFTIKICFSALKHFQLLLNRAGTSHTSFPNILLLVWMLTSFDFGNRNYQGHMISLALSWNWCTNWSETSQSVLSWVTGTSFLTQPSPSLVSLQLFGLFRHIFHQFSFQSLWIFASCLCQVCV